MVCRIDLAYYERSVDDIVRCDVALSQGMEVLPSSQVLAFAAADFYENAKHFEVSG